MAVLTRTRRGGSGLLLALGLAVAAALFLRSCRRLSRGSRTRPRRLDRWRQPLPVGDVHDPAVVAVVHGRRRPDRAQHRRARRRPQHDRPAPLLQLDARAQPLRPPAVGRRRPAGLDGRAPPLRRRPLPAGREPDLRRRAAVGGEATAPDEPARRAGRFARQPRLDADRLPATADPARTPRSRSRASGWSGRCTASRARTATTCAPNTKLTRPSSSASSRRGATPRSAMIWDGRYVSIQPVPTSTVSAGGATSDPKRARAWPRGRARRPSQPHRRSRRPRPLRRSRHRQDRSRSLTRGRRRPVTRTRLPHRPVPRRRLTRRCSRSGSC